MEESYINRRGGNNYLDTATIQIVIKPVLTKSFDTNKE